MQSKQYFVHYRDDGPGAAAPNNGHTAEPWSRLFIFDTLEDVVVWKEKTFPTFARERLNARIENWWSPKYSADEAHAVMHIKAARRKARSRLARVKGLLRPSGKGRRLIAVSE